MTGGFYISERFFFFLILHAFSHLSACVHVFINEAPGGQTGDVTNRVHHG